MAADTQSRTRSSLPLSETYCGFPQSIGVEKAEVVWQRQGKRAKEDQRRDDPRRGGMGRKSFERANGGGEQQQLGVRRGDGRNGSATGRT